MKLISFLYHHCHFHQNCHYHLYFLFITSISIYTHFTTEKYITKLITFSQTTSRHMKSSLLCKGSPTGEGKLASKAKDGWFKSSLVNYSYN